MMHVIPGSDRDPGAQMHITYLEGKLKLFTCNWHGGNVQNLLIEAHGFAVHRNSPIGLFQRIRDTYRFKVPGWTTLFFYGPHKFILKIKEAYPNKIMKGEVPPLEASTPGMKVVNYELKYASVRNPLSTDQDMERFLFNARYSEDPNFSAHPFRVFDIVTTEPSDPQGITLKEVLDVLNRTGRQYPRIHCLICRNELGAPKRRYYPGYHNEEWQDKTTV